jgi:trigger factor
MGEFETMEQLRAKMAETIERQEAERIEADFRESLVKSLVERNPLEVPASLVDKQLDMMLENSRKRLASQRMTLEMMGMSEEKYRTDFRDVAEHKVKSSILMSTLARQEGVTIEPSDIEGQLRKIAEENGHDYDKLKEFYTINRQANETLRDYLLDEKIMSLLTLNADIA